MATAKKTATADRLICFIKFAHCVKVHNNVCVVYTKFNAFSYTATNYLFLGGLSLYMVWCTFSTVPLLPKVVYADSDRTYTSRKSVTIPLP